MPKEDTRQKPEERRAEKLTDEIRSAAEEAAELGGGDGLVTVLEKKFFTMSPKEQKRILENNPQFSEPLKTAYLVKQLRGKSEDEMKATIEKMRADASKRANGDEQKMAEWDASMEKAKEQLEATDGIEKKPFWKKAWDFAF